MTSLIDTFFNMRRGFCGYWDVKMKIICPELYFLDVDDYYDIPLEETQWYEYKNKKGLEVKPYDHNESLMNRGIRAYKNEITSSVPFLRFNRNFGDFNLLHSITQNENKFEGYVVVCSARLIYEILMGADIEIKCKRLIVLDSLDTYKSKVGIFPNFDDLFKTMFKNTHVTQLSNPANFRETKFEQIEYYHKLSLRRLNSLKLSGRLKDEYTFNRTNKEKTKIGEYHFENMGKGIFEHLFYSKPVHYKPDGMFTKDGLWFYLNLFGIDAEKEQTITGIKKDEIMNHLFYKGSDTLYGKKVLMR
jgi:hypothetical protein